MVFKGNLLIIGLGAVSKCAIPIIFKEVDLRPQNVVLMDFEEYPPELQFILEKGARYVRERITEENYERVLSMYVGKGDIILDLAWDIDTCAMLDWCYRNGVRYLNTSVEVWDPYAGDGEKPVTERTLYHRQMKIRRMIQSWPVPEGPTAVLEHGANPGLVSHFTKKALVDIADKILKDNPQPDPRINGLKEALRKEDFPKLAQLADVKVIHISERDTQISSQPKKVNEFVNTWSVEGFHEEGIAPAEMGWGTHERVLPPHAVIHQGGPGNQICLAQMGCRTLVRSWVPCGEIVGMVIRHGEAFSISEHLTVWENGTPIYRPTVHYAYLPCDAAISSLWELEMRGYNKLQENKRIMTEEIIDGRDELGCLLMGHDYKSWWIGSLLDIHESRQLVPGNNATVLQVAASAVAALVWVIKNPYKGVCLPDDLPYQEILDLSKPYLGPCKSMPVDWTPLSTKRDLFTRFNGSRPEPEDVWQFNSFLVKP